MLFLEPTAEERLAFANMVYDSKKSVWCPHKAKGGFVRAMLTGNVDEKKGKVECEAEGGEVSSF